MAKSSNGTKGAKSKKKDSNAVKKQAKRRSNYFKGVWAELKKVNWPNRRELLTYTGVVVGAVLFSAAAIWLADTVIALMMRVLV